MSSRWMVVTACLFLSLQHCSYSHPHRFHCFPLSPQRNIREISPIKLLLWHEKWWSTSMASQTLPSAVPPDSHPGHPPLSVPENMISNLLTQSGPTLYFAYERGKEVDGWKVFIHHCHGHCFKNFCKLSSIAVAAAIQNG